MGRHARTVLLVRDPLEIVLSRTFRKPKWRKRSAPTDTDAEYVNKNIRFVKKFFDSVAQHTPVCVIRYEDVKKDPVEMLSRILQLVDLDVPEQLLRSTIERHSATSQLTSGVRLSNIYPGPRNHYDRALIEHASVSLQALRNRLGYSDPGL
jgi:hypothetical protein